VHEGWQPVIVHGGGPAITQALNKLGIHTEFVDGLRKTTAEVLDVVEMVLAGKINKEIVRRLLAAHVRSIGLSGTDGRLLQARPLPHAHKLGFVGEVETVNRTLLDVVVGAGFVPVIAPIGLAMDGVRYNINADSAAGAVADAVGANPFVVVTDVMGVMRVVDGVRHVIERLTADDIEHMIARGDITGGMIPKVRSAIACLGGSVKEVIVVNGADAGVLRKVLRGERVGTRIVLA
jgi:acetylglutamate kinase